jgi:hypothetical protein
MSPDPFYVLTAKLLTGKKLVKNRIRAAEGILLVNKWTCPLYASLSVIHNRQLLRRNFAVLE